MKGPENILQFKSNSEKPRISNEGSGTVVSLEEKRNSLETQKAIRAMKESVQRWHDEIGRRLAIENKGGSSMRMRFGTALLYDTKLFMEASDQLEKEAAANEPGAHEHFVRLFAAWQKIEDDLKNQIEVIGRQREAHVA